MKITKRYLNGCWVLLGLYGTSEEIQWELNRLFNSKSLDEPMDVTPGDTYMPVFVKREKWIRGKILTRLLNWPKEKLNQFKGRMGGAWRAVESEILAEIEVMPYEDRPVSDDYALSFSLDNPKELSYLEA